MKIPKLGAVVLILGISGCATTDGLQSDGSFTYRLTPEQVTQCERGGGCSTVTLQYEHELVRKAARHFCGVEI